MFADLAEMIGVVVAAVVVGAVTVAAAVAVVLFVRAGQWWQVKS